MFCFSPRSGGKRRAQRVRSLVFLPNEEVRRSRQSLPVEASTSRQKLPPARRKPSNVHQYVLRPALPERKPSGTRRHREDNDSSRTPKSPPRPESPSFRGSHRHSDARATRPSDSRQEDSEYAVTAAREESSRYLEKELSSQRFSDSSVDWD